MKSFYVSLKLAKYVGQMAHRLTVLSRLERGVISLCDPNDRGGMLFRRRFPALRQWGLNEKETAALVAILLFVTLAYLRCLRNDFVYDDFPQIVFNSNLGTWSFVWKSMIHDTWWFRDPNHLPQSPYYRPLQNISFAMGYLVAGASAFRWHLLKILLHLGAVILSFRFSQLLTGSKVTSLLASLLFGVLAVHADAIVWVSAITEPWCAIFELAAFCSFIQRPTGQLSGLALPLILFALAAFTHEASLVFLLLIAAYVFLLDPGIHTGNNGDVQQEPVSWRTRFTNTCLLTAPFLAVVLLYMGARLYALGSGGFLGMPWTIVASDLAGGKIMLHKIVVTPPAFEILNTLPLVVATYLELSLLPWLVGPTHPVKLIESRSIENFYLPFAALFLLALVGYLVLRKSSHSRLYLFCAIWWLVSLIPALNLTQIISVVQDRYEYVGSIGLCLLIADLSVTVATKDQHWQRAVALGVSGIIALQVVALWRVQPDWHDDLTFFGKCVEMFPDSTYYRSQFASQLDYRGNHTAAIEQLAAASAHADRHDYRLHLELMKRYATMGRKADAQREYNLYLKAFAPWLFASRPKNGVQ